MKKNLPLLLIFLIALVFRTYNLTEIPPGLTHDEANHGREAIGILDGDLRFYFPANYGSEPVYSYTAAFSMLLLGENLLALRLVNVLFGLGAMGLAFVWAARAFDRRMAIVAAGVTAVTFWPVASSREALRAGMLPFFMVLTVWFFWQLVMNDEAKGQRRTVLAFAVSIAITLHIYLAARVTWLIFPVFLVYLVLLHRSKFKESWRPVLAGLMLAGLLVIPMFVYLQNHPEAQTRLSMLDGTLQGLREGNVAPVLHNAKEALLAFVWPGYGDQFLAYNIPGRPVFDGVTAVFFIIGLLVSLWRWKRPNYAFLLLWFGIGIIPSLLTGATANTTRNLAALPSAMLLPAVGFTVVTEWVNSPQRRKGKNKKESSALSASLRLNRIAVIAAIWLIFAGGVTARDYFVRWGESPDVRGAYQHTLVEGLAFLEADASDLPLVISSVYPGPAHDPSISLVLSPETSARARWVDARYGLLFPGGGNGRILIPASTPIHPALVQFVKEVTAVTLRPDDLDPQFGLYELNRSPLDQWNQMEPVNFDNAVILRAAHWLTTAVQPGAVGQMVTVWEVVDPERVGPAVLPFYTTDVTLFTQVLDDSGQIVAQRDSLEAPSWDWQTGDVIVQIHPLTVPVGTAPGNYRTIVGLYDKLSGERRPVIGEDGAVLKTFAEAPSLQVSNP